MRNTEGVITCLPRTRETLPETREVDVKTLIQKLIFDALSRN